MKAFLVPSMRCKTTGAERARGPDTADSVFPCYLNESCRESRAGEGQAAGRSEKGWEGQPDSKASGKTSWLSPRGDFEFRLFISKGLWKTPIMDREEKAAQRGCAVHSAAAVGGET